MAQPNSLEAVLYTHIQADKKLFDFLQRAPLDGLAVWSLTDESRQWFNPLLSQTLGYESIEPLLWQRLVHPEDRIKMENHLQILRSGDRPSSSAIFRFFHRSKQIIRLECQFQPLSQPLLLLCFTNISSRQSTLSEKEIEDTITTSAFFNNESNYKSVISALGEGVVVQDLNEKIVMSNESAARILGLSVNQLIGKDSYDPRWQALKEDGSQFLPEEHPSMVTLRTGLPVNDLIMDINIGANYRAKIMANSRPVNDRAGKMVGVVVTFSNITKAKKSEETLLFQSKLLDAVGQALIATNPKGEILYWNLQAEKLYGWKAEEVIGKNASLVIPNPQANTDAREIMNQLILGEPWSGEFRMIAKNGRTFPAYVVNSPVMDDHGSLTAVIGASQDISERKRSEEALLASEARFKAFANHLPGMVFIKIPHGKHLFGNQQILDFMGVDLSTYQQKTAKDLLDPENLQMTEQTDREVMKTKKSLSHEFYHEPAQAWYREYKFPISKNLIGGFILDITKQKLAEKALQESEEQYKTITNSLPGAVMKYRIKADGTEDLMFLSHKAEKVWEAPREEVMNSQMRLFAPIFPDDLIGLRDSIQKSAKELSIWHYEWRVKVKDGAIKWVSGRGIPAKMEDGSIVWHSLILDITRQKESEEALRKSEENLSRITNNMNEVIWLRSAEDGTILFVNRAFETVTGFPCQKLYEDSEFFYKMIPEPQRKDAWEKILKYREGFQFDEEIPIVRKDGKTRWTWVRLFPIRNDAGEVVSHTGIAKDITDKKEAQLIRKNLENLKIRNQEMEQFAYVASHDLQEPLRTVKSFVGLLERKYGDKLETDAKEYLAFISDASSRMILLIKGLLKYSRLGNDGTQVEVNLSELVQQVLLDLSTAIEEKNAQIIVEELPCIIGFEMELRQLFLNLINNALKFCKDGVSPIIHIQAREKDSFWIFSIKDNGIGIAEVHQGRIFQLFQRLHTQVEYEGTGIGLSHCKKIVELHNGRIWLVSAPGEGSTFSFSLRGQSIPPIEPLPNQG